MQKQVPHRLRYRQVHLDFHTSPLIEDIGKGFDAQHWQGTLQRGEVDSITCFATCHHGYAYYNTAVGERHPHLDFDLLRRQYDASKAIGVNVPIYLTAGINNWAAANHPGWREIDHEGRYTGWQGISPIEPGYNKMCFNSPYLQLLCEQITEVVTLFPDCDGVFLDIIHQSPCCCRYCMESMHAADYDPTNPEDRFNHATGVMRIYYEQTTAAARSGRDSMPVFHNSSHITPGRTDLLPYFSHLELESLPTGGWGYDHFPLSARYVSQLPRDAMGMTGKFHNTWGEFGGYKHPNALRYECAAMIAHGTKCSVGDQLHPSGKLDESTYRLIGNAYREVKAKEPFCNEAVNIADIGLISSAAFHHGGKSGPDHTHHADVGASRLLLECHYLFNVLDSAMDFSPYRLLILPDDIPVGDELYQKLEGYLEGGGRLLLTGASGIEDEGQSCRFDLGAELQGPSEYEPDYALYNQTIRPKFSDSPLVMYRRSMRLKCTDGESLGRVFDPYFNRSYRHFSSHQHTPPRPESSGFDAGVRKGPITYLPHPLFTLYAAYGSVAYKHILDATIRVALGGPRIFDSNLPSNARATLTHQPEAQRYVLHLLYANLAQRGGPVAHEGSTNRESYALEVIEDLPTLHNTEISLHGLKSCVSIRSPFSEFQPQRNESGSDLSLTIPRINCHELIALGYDR